MYIDLNLILNDVKFDCHNWEIYDLRIDLPKNDLGSDTVNLQPNYSNPTCIFSYEGITGVGIGFTLGKGNNFVCESIRYILKDLENIKLGELLSQKGKIQDILSNPSQLRWLSPNSGCAYMAAGIILNTLLDWAAKKLDLPLWKLLSLSNPESLINWIDNRNYSNIISNKEIEEYLSTPYSKILERINQIEIQGMPSYHTTWIGSDVLSLSKEVKSINKTKGITFFKYKIHNSAKWVEERLHQLKENLEINFNFSVDSNQMLSFESAKEILEILNKKGCVWLEEPFAPDNIQMHSALMSYKDDRQLAVKISSGENCPNSHVALDLISNNSLDIFQLDACRVLSICDQIPIMLGCKKYGKDLIPHAGGSGLDELVPHLQAFFLCRIDTEINFSDSLMENVGFCSHLFSNPTNVKNGIIEVSKKPGYIVGLNDMRKIKNSKNKIVWLDL